MYNTTSARCTFLNPAAYSLVSETLEVKPRAMTSSAGDRVTSPEVPRPSAVAIVDNVDNSAAGET